MLCAGEELRPYLERGIGVTLADKAYFIGDWRDGIVVAVAGLSNWCGHDVEISLWSAGTLGRAFVRRVMRYVFDELGCCRMTARVAEPRSGHDLWPRLGFVLEGRLRKASNGTDDMMVYGLLKDDFAWQ